MREFKLKKWYPSLPVQWKDDETIVVVQNDPFGYRLHPSLKRIVNTKIVSFEEVESSEYWQEIKPDLRNYEIIGLYTDKDVFTKEPTNLWYRKNADTNEGHYTNLAEGQLYGNLPLKIYSIRRLSDGEVFTIGDRIDNTASAKLLDRKIKEFTPNDEFFVKTSSGRSKLNSIEHRERPVFKTEDGVEIFEGDIVYQVSTLDKRYDIYSTKARKEMTPPPSYFKYFSTKEKAEGFIIRNKPVWSLQELYDIFDPASINSRTRFISIIGKETKKKLKF